MQDGQLVTFAEVNGMPTLNDKKPRRIKNVKVQLQRYQQSLRAERPCQAVQSEREALTCSAVLLSIFIMVHDAVLSWAWSAHMQRGCQGQTAL